jgi:hypothetical protein
VRPTAAPSQTKRMRRAESFVEAVPLFAPRFAKNKRNGRHSHDLANQIRLEQKGANPGDGGKTGFLPT